MKYKLGEYVKVEFLAKITEAYLEGEEIIYAVDTGNTFARRVKEEMMFPLATEEKTIDKI